MPRKTFLYRVPGEGSLYFTKYDGSDNKEEEVASENAKHTSH